MDEAAHEASTEDLSTTDLGHAEQMMRGTPSSSASAQPHRRLRGGYRTTISTPRRRRHALDGAHGMGIHAYSTDSSPESESESDTASDERASTDA